MTKQYGQQVGNEKMEDKAVQDKAIQDKLGQEIIQDEQINCYQQNLKESLDFVNEMKSAVLEDWRKIRHDYFIIESRKKDLEKILQNLLQQEDKAGAFFIPSEHNENRKEQDLIQEELQLAEEQQKRKQEILEQREQRAEKMDQLYQCLKSYDILLHQVGKEDNITNNNTKESLSEKNIFMEGTASEEKDIQKAAGAESNQEKSIAEERSDTGEDKRKDKPSSKAGTKLGYSLENGEATALLAIQEYERKRIAREMHDSTIQDLTTLIHRIEFVEKLIDMDMVRAKMELATLKEIVKKSVDEMRNIIYDLHPMQIEEFGLKAMLQTFAAKIKDEYKISVNLSAEDDQCKDNTVNLTLYRIIQEACNNSIRYSKATQITIELKYSESQIHLAIEDNGLGFDMEEVQKKAMSEGRGFGLSVMKERVHLLSGKFDISSASGAGTKIAVIIPRLVY